MRRACGRTDDALIGVGNLPAAEAAAKELPRVSLADALELTLLIARKEPRRHPRVAARWLLRYLEDCDEATIDEAALVAARLAALSGAWPGRGRAHAANHGKAASAGGHRER